MSGLLLRYAWHEFWPVLAWHDCDWPFMAFRPNIPGAGPVTADRVGEDDDVL